MGRGGGKKCPPPKFFSNFFFGINGIPGGYKKNVPQMFLACQKNGHFRAKIFYDCPSNLTLNAISLPKSKIVKKFIEVQKIKLNNVCSNSFFGQNMTSFFYFSMDFNEIFRDSSLCHMVQK